MKRGSPNLFSYFGKPQKKSKVPVVTPTIYEDGSPSDAFPVEADASKHQFTFSSHMSPCSSVQATPSVHRDSSDVQNRWTTSQVSVVTPVTYPVNLEAEKLNQSPATSFPETCVNPATVSLQRPVYSEDELQKRRRELHRNLEEDMLSEKKLKEVSHRFSWLTDAKVIDAHGRRPRDTEFDPRTVEIPKQVLHKMSDSQKQYWETKKQYMDLILFFKVGTFYELYEDDAQVVHNLLEWKLTITGVGHCRQVGCPLKGLQDAVASLTNAGYKVGVMDQMETKAEAVRRNPKNSIIRRQLVNVYTPATAMEPESEDAVHLLALCQYHANSGDVDQIGYAFLDAATDRLYIGSHPVDANLAGLKTLLTHVSPKEVLIPRGNFDAATLRCMKSVEADIKATQVPSGLEFPHPETAAIVIGSDNMMGERSAWPPVLATAPDVTLSAVAGLFEHLKRLKMFSDVKAGLEVLAFSGFQGRMRVDAASMVNLEILGTESGDNKGSLLSVVDACRSKAGHRLVRSWLCRPLTDIAAITQRQDAVQEILDRPGLLDPIFKAIQACPDIERSVGRCNTVMNAPSEGLPTSLLEKIHQKRLAVLHTAVLDLSTCLEAMRSVAGSKGGPPNAPLLVSLLSADPGQESEACAVLKEIKKSIAVQHASAAKGKKKAVPHSLSLNSEQFPQLLSFSDDERILAEIDSVTELLIEFKLHAKVWDSIVPAIAAVDVLASFALFAETAVGPTCRPNFLTSKSHTANDANGAVFQAGSMWHPCLPLQNSSVPIPNDLSLGSPVSTPGAASLRTVTPRTLLLTGANMGGKSTLLRTTCVTTILAQIGCHAPAQSLTLTPVDAIFTRVGATDRIISGESTFMVECSECAAILRDATPMSLVVFDELGRGTSTFDGYSIAHAVLDHMASSIDCRMLFATHYHPLTAEFSNSPRISLGHMAAIVPNQKDSDSSHIVFTYKLQSGASPKSYGLLVAALAGIPSSVRSVAAEMGAMLEDNLAACFGGCRGSVDEGAGDSSDFGQSLRLLEGIEQGQSVHHLRQLLVRLN